ncbi:MAG: hypothetical protein O7C75_14270 [Verrucomicrobia bacterium]|nr:hypothetical protein [Verrucomicrobiota bacterium]
MTDIDELNGLLDQWQDLPARDPQLKHRVWTRIASGDQRANTSIQNWLNRFTTALSRPLTAVAFIGASVICGLLIGEFRVSQAKQIQTQELDQTYIELIDSQQSYFRSEGPK